MRASASSPGGTGKEDGTSPARMWLPLVAAFLRAYICLLEKYPVYSQRRRVPNTRWRVTRDRAWPLWHCRGWPQHERRQRCQGHFLRSLYSPTLRCYDHWPPSSASWPGTFPTCIPSSKILSSLTYQLPPREPVCGAIRFFFFLQSFSKKRKRVDIVGLFLFMLLTVCLLRRHSNIWILETWKIKLVFCP